MIRAFLSGQQNAGRRSTSIRVASTGATAETMNRISHLMPADNVLLETMSAGHRADFERERERVEHERERVECERERADRLMAELLQAKSDVTTAREMVARLEGEIAFLRARARTDSSLDKTERRLGQLAASLVESDRKAARG